MQYKVMVEGKQSKDGDLRDAVTASSTRRVRRCFLLPAMTSGNTDNRSPLSIAFICPSISGHANVHLANLHYLLTLGPAQAPPLRLHLISEEPLRGRLKGLPCSDRHRVSFHALADACYWKDAGEGAVSERRHGPPRVFAGGGLCAYEVLRRAVGMPPGCYLGYYEGALRILEELRLELDSCAVDVLMAAGPIGDACTKAGVQYGILSPIPSLDFCRMATMSFNNLWKYPA